MPDISIVIVSYNVKYFLRQCIQSIFNSNFDGSYEVIVVDNNSQDGTVELLGSQFSNVELIANQDNLGFSKANNQAFKISKGKYTLILNPDTVLQEDTFQKCFDYLEQHQNVGAVGVKMLDGSGTYLPESKRGFPKPIYALFKMLGLSKIFSKSSFFNHYYQGHLDNDNVHNIEVLTGAFCLIRSDLLNAINGFDEDYFMYGEDIELCYQIKQKGFLIAYLPTTSIIHFKGESTPKQSLRYFRNFYGAMGIYAKKRNVNSNTSWKALLQLAILLSAITGILKSLGSFLFRGLFDWFIISFSAIGLIKVWSSYYFNNSGYYENVPIYKLIGIFVFIILVVYGFFGQYDKRHNFKHLTYGFAFSTLVILSTYSLLPLDWRFSRSIVLSISIFSPFILLITRKIYNKIQFGNWGFDAQINKRVTIVGTKDSCDIAKDILDLERSDTQVVNFDFRQFLEGGEGGLIDHVKTNKVNEIIFCTKDIDKSSIFRTMAKVGSHVNFKMMDDNNQSILSSHSKNRKGEWYTLDIGFKIDQPFHKRAKRSLDLFVFMLIVLLFPFIAVFSKSRVHIFKNLMAVLLGSKTWIGYSQNDQRLTELPKLKEGVFGFDNSSEDNQGHNSNVFYARNYSVWLEIENIWQAFFNSKNY